MFSRLKGLFSGAEDLLRIRLKYDPWFCIVEHEYKGSPMPGALESTLIAAFVSYLARFFFICDERHAEPIRTYLLDALPRETPVGNQLPKVFFGDELFNRFTAILYKTLSDAERSAASKAFPGAPLIPALPEEVSRSNVLVTYVFRLRLNRLLSNFLDMSSPIGSTLLPAFALGHVYWFVTSHLQSERSRLRLLDTSVALLQGYEQSDYRDPHVLVSWPNEVLADLLFDLLPRSS